MTSPASSVSYRHQPSRGRFCAVLLLAVVGGTATACSDVNDFTEVSPPPRELSTTTPSLTPVPEEDEVVEAAPSPSFGVVHSDYETYAISLWHEDGSAVAANFLSPSSATSGLSAPLSDVVLPSQPPEDGELVVIGRTPASVLTFVDLASGGVRAQLDVGTGFGANPHDYVRISDTKAYVPRHAPNLDPGREPWDAGDDVLIVDPKEPRVVGRIDLTSVVDGAPEGIFVRPTRAVRVGQRVHLLALAMNITFDGFGDSRLVTIDTERDEVVDVLVLSGLQNCGSLALSPSEQTLAVGCNGPFSVDPATGFPNAGVSLIDIQEQPRELERFVAADLGGETVSSISFASESSLAFTTYGRYDDAFEQAVPDTARVLDLAAGELLGGPLHETATDPFSLGQIRCRPSSSCLLADAETGGGQLHQFRIGTAGELLDKQSTSADARLGLPPRSIGAL